MIGPFPIRNEDLHRYLIDFHIGLLLREERDEFGKWILPPEDMMDFIFKQRETEGFPLRAYQEEEQPSRENLEHLIELAIKDQVDLRKGFSKTIMTPDGRPIEVSSYEMDSRSSILYVSKRIKGMETFWLKSFRYVRGQSEESAYDHSAFRIIVESQEARRFRASLKFQGLKPEERRSYRNLFGDKDFSKLSGDEIAVFNKNFPSDYRSLNERQREEYRRRFEDQHREICKNLARKIALVGGYDTIPQNPHYMKLDGIDVRAQRQIIVDHRGKSTVEFEYILKRSSAREDDLYKKLLGMPNIAIDEPRRASPVRYIEQLPDQNIRIGYLFNLGDLVLNFHLNDENATINIDRLAWFIKDRYDKATRKFADVEDKDERDTKIMKFIKLGMEHVPGYFIFSSTTTKDLWSKYPGIILDENKTLDMFVDIKLGKKAEKDNRYEHAKVSLCLGPESKQISGECQIRDPIMDYNAEEGQSAKGDRLEYERIQAQRSVRPIQPPTEADIAFGLAFFHNDDASRARFYDIYFDYYARSIANVLVNIANVKLGESELGKLRESFDTLELLLEAAEDKAKVAQILGADGKTAALARVVSPLNSILSKYAEGKGVSIFGFRNNIWEISQRLNQIADREDIILDYMGPNQGLRRITTEQELFEFLYQAHLEALYKAFVSLAESNDSKRMAASLLVGRLIISYDDFYARSDVPSPPKELLDNYKKRVLRFGQEKGWTPYHVPKPNGSGRTLFGYIPGRFLKEQTRHKILGNLEIINPTPTRPNDPFATHKFDVEAMDHLRSLHDRYFAR